MIQIINPTECCGCNGCVQVCPKSCISFNEDNEGFRYPNVDQSRCIGCNLCEKVCPVLNVPDGQSIKNVYAAIYEDENKREDSSSGAVFSYLAEAVIDNGGVVFGGVFDDEWEVKHECIEDRSDLERLRGSKYLQSRIEDSYKEVKSYLDSGRLVLFSGTPCQIAGLTKFLRKKYDNLICIDFICHGVPSPKVWRRYLKEIIAEDCLGETVNSIESVNFRAKSLGWRNYSLRIDTSKGSRDVSHYDDYYCRAFNRNMTLRPICYQCPFKGGHSASDLTLADFWGINEVDSSMYDDKGTSMVISYGKDVIALDKLKIKEHAIEYVKRYNPSYYHSATVDDNRSVFFDHFNDKTSLIKLFKRCITPSNIERVINRIYRLTHKK